MYVRYRGYLMRTEEFVESYFDAWNHLDPTGVADHLTADGVYCDVPNNELRSHDELITSLREVFSHYRHRYELIGEIVSSESAIAFQYRVYPFEHAQKQASSKYFCGAEFMTLSGDAALTITDYYEMPDIVQPANSMGSTSGQISGRKYEKSGLESEQLRTYKNRLENIMQQEQAYLRSDLTLPKLARDVNCSVNHLSQVINSGFGMSFFDYLNQLRVEHAKNMLKRCDIQSNSILNIAFTAGFNSNSAFYAAFKRFVGQTPAQFRRAHLD